MVESLIVIGCAVVSLWAYWAITAYELAHRERERERARLAEREQNVRAWPLLARGLFNAAIQNEDFLRRARQRAAGWIPPFRPFHGRRDTAGRVDWRRYGF